MAGKFWVVIRRQGSKRKATADYGLTYDREKAQIVQLKSSSDLDALQKQVIKDLKIPSDWDALLFDTESLGGESNKLKAVTDTAFSKMTDIFNYYHDPEGGVFYTGEFAIRATFYNGGTRSDSSLDFSFMSPKITPKKPRKKKDQYVVFDFTKAKGTQYDGKKVYMKQSDYDLEMKKYRSKVRMLVSQGRGLVAASRKSHKAYYEEIYKTQWFVRWCSEKLSGAQFPDFGIWNNAEGELNEAERFINIGDYELALNRFEMFETDYNGADKVWRGYRNRTEKSAENAVVGLKITKEVSFTILKVVMVPAVSGAFGTGLVVKALTEVGMDTGIEAVKEMVTTMAEHKNELRKKFSWKEFIKKMGINAASGFVTNLFGGLRGAFKDKMKEELMKSLAGKSVPKNTIVRYLDNEKMDKVLEYVEDKALEKVVQKVASKLEKKQETSMDQFIISVCREYLKDNSSLVDSIANKIATVEAQ